MGYRARWLAVKNGELASVLKTVELRQEKSMNEAVNDPGHYSVMMPGGWLVVIGDGYESMDSIRAEHARTLSAHTEAIHFYCDDTPMCASIATYRDGKELWSLEYDGSDGIATPTVTGTPPAMVIEIVRQCQNAQRDSGEDDVDHIYEAAPKIGLELTGFRHDTTLADGEHLPILVLGK
jgi:hypothetical protein